MSRFNSDDSSEMEQIMAADRERERKRKNFEKTLKREEKKGSKDDNSKAADMEALAQQLMTADKKTQKKIMKKMEAMQAEMA